MIGDPGDRGGERGTSLDHVASSTGRVTSAGSEGVLVDFSVAVAVSRRVGSGGRGMSVCDIVGVDFGLLSVSSGVVRGMGCGEGSTNRKDQHDIRLDR